MCRETPRSRRERDAGGMAVELGLKDKGFHPRSKGRKGVQAAAAASRGRGHAKHVQVGTGPWTRLRRQLTRVGGEGPGPSCPCG